LYLPVLPNNPRFAGVADGPRGRARCGLHERHTARACLTAAVTDVRTRPAGPDDALVVAGLTLQCALHRGGRPEHGFLDRFARAWSAQVRTRPAWLAEAGDQPAGYLQAAVVPALPWPDGGDAGGVLLVDTFFVRPTHRGLGVGEHLLRAAVDWSRAQGLGEVRMAAGQFTRPMVERVGFVPHEAAYHLELA
jgi:GNAT superfamily N-acetyltransferase